MRYDELNKSKITVLQGANIQRLFGKYRLLLLIILAYFLAIIPIFHIVNILETTGVDSVSNDYLRFTKLADRVLSPGYDWSNYFKDSFDNNVHSYAFLFIVRLGLAVLTHLSVNAEIYLGLILTVINSMISFSLLTHYTVSNSPFRYFFLSLLTAFLFSNSQISTFSYGETALQMGFIHLGIVVGLWMLILKSKSVLTTWVMLGSGVVASFSGGAGLLAWPVFFLAILMTRTGSLTKYSAWLVGMVIGALPYLAFSSFSPFHENFFPFYFFNFEKVVTGLGLPMANQINNGIQTHTGAYTAGLLGLGILFLLGFLLYKTWSNLRFQSVIPALLFICWGFLGSLQISISRSLLAPWYTTTYIVFWIGLLGLCFTLIQPDPDSLKRRDTFLDWDMIARTGGYAGLGGILLLFLLTNLTYQDKSFYLFSRSPVSAACLRNYQIAPTYCEGYVYQWGVGNPSFLPQMASLLEKNSWSVFGPHQELTLQGDSMVGKVSFQGSNGPAHPLWVSGNDDRPTSWTDYHHLNLLLSPGQSIQWQIDFPQNLDHAEFLMGLSLVDKASCHDQQISIQFETIIDSQLKTLPISDLCKYLQEADVSENLSDFRGNRMVISIRNETLWSDEKPIRLHYPRILLDEDLSKKLVFLPIPLNQPLNTDLSPGFTTPKTSANYLQAMTKSELTLYDLIPQNGDGTLLRSGQSPWARYTLETPICHVSQTSLFFQLGLSNQILKRMVKIGFQYQGNESATQSSSIDFPLLSDEKLHGYTLNMDLINIPDSTCITSFDFQFLDSSLPSTDQLIQIKAVGFLP